MRKRLKNEGTCVKKECCIPSIGNGETYPIKWGRGKSSSSKVPIERGYAVRSQEGTAQGINISHLGKKKIIFKYAFSGGCVNSLEGYSFLNHGYFG